MLRISALYLRHQTLISEWFFFSVMMVNSCKGYSSSFFDVLLMCVVSAASLQIMVGSTRSTGDFQPAFALN